ncbi:MAG TPA: flavodoxin family protein [Candidatus Omnitrophota bacterium]|nr:flavodoxin family protein [Candidatus Omnitrophota bacterium]HPT39939.1 flavodoxin family protein [Candidatus Omnitrophota bacterium]
MKKIILILSCLVVPALVCSETILQKETKVLVVYYSRTGHTQLVAEKLAKKFNADLEQLIDQHKRSGPLGFYSAGRDAVSKNTTVIAPLKHSLKDYDILLIGGPSWVGNVTPAIRTFITRNDLSGKKIGLFGLCHLTGVEHALEEASGLISKARNKKIPVLPLREKELAENSLTKKIDVFYQAMQADELLN